MGDLPEARRCLQESVSIFRKHRNESGLVLAMIELALVLEAAGHTPESRVVADEALLRARNAAVSSRDLERLANLCSTLGL